MTLRGWPALLVFVLPWLVGVVEICNWIWGVVS